MPSDKRSNNALWSLIVPDGANPREAIPGIVASCNDSLRNQDPPRTELRLAEIDSRELPVTLGLYYRRYESPGFYPLVRPYLARAEADRTTFALSLVDACLFIATDASLYAVTSGGAYHIISDLVDYSFPFEMAKRLISNKFTASAVRDMTGATSSRQETYRREYSIAKSESAYSIWKRLVGRVDPTLVSDDPTLQGMFRGSKPPTIEVKGSLVLRKRLNLYEIVELTRSLESLPDPTEEHLRELSFLDNIYPVKGDKEIVRNLDFEFIEQIRTCMLGDEVPDVDVLDPLDSASYSSGSRFKLGRSVLGDDPPEVEDLLPVLHERLKDYLKSPNDFHERFMSLRLGYGLDEDNPKLRVTRKLVDFLHGQASLAGDTYFRLDKTWYFALGRFLENLKEDFLAEVFSATSPTLVDPSEISFLTWLSTEDEEDFNIRQAKEDSFYLGDRVFAKSDRGKVELFDLLKVDGDQLFVIHVKKDFNAKMRDACSQIRLASEVLDDDIRTGKVVLARYYDEWRKQESNKKVDRATFLSWFDKSVSYVVLCSTRTHFTPPDFEGSGNPLSSHIARREVLATRHHLKRHDLKFRLAHTRRSDREI